MLTNSTVGEIVERLIYIKDSYALKNADLNAINDVCNILSHNFDRMSTVNDLLRKEQ